MQVIFEPGCSPREYIDRGHVEPERLQMCPCCRIGKPHKHSLYRRFYLDGLHVWRIKIRRYYCTRCRATIPSSTYFLRTKVLIILASTLESALFAPKKRTQFKRMHKKADS